MILAPAAHPPPLWQLDRRWASLFWQIIPACTSTCAPTPPPSSSVQTTHSPLRMTVRPAGSSPSRQTWMRSGPSTK